MSVLSGFPYRFMVVWGLAILVVGATSSPAHASVGSAFAKTIAKRIGKQGASETIEKLNREVGETVVRRTTDKLAREGGEQAVEEAGELFLKHGSEVIRAIDNVPHPTQMLRSMRALPDDEVAVAAARLAAGESGQELAELTVRHGVKTLRAEVMHPGIGHSFVRALGDDGAELSLRLTTGQATQIGRHVDDIAALPPGPRTKLLAMIGGKAGDFTAFIARFVENNPGKVLFTTASTGVILTNADRILGGDEIVFDADGNPTLISKPGIVGRTGQGVSQMVAEPVDRLLNWVVIIVASALALFAASKVWRSIRKDHLAAESVAASPGPKDTEPKDTEPVETYDRT